MAAYLGLGRPILAPDQILRDRPTDSVQRPAIHSVPSSSGRSGSTLSGGAAHHKFCARFSPPTLHCCARLWSKMA